MDTEVIQDTRTRIKAGDPSDCIVGPDALGGEPYCFRLKNDHPDGAHAAIAPYKPWWKVIEQRWNPEIENNRAQFKRWTQNRFIKNKHPETHVAMNGGEFYIPAGPEEDAFLEAYAKCLLAGHRMYLVEQFKCPWTPPCFRLFVDLDFKQLKGITERGIEAASTVCSKTVKKFFPTVDSHTIVASTTYKDDNSMKDSSGNVVPLVKTGVHLYWPKHFVTPMQALHIRESIIADLTEAFGTRAEPSMNQWDDVVDESVYPKSTGGGGSGLRMIGSCKTKNCGTCKGLGKLKIDGSKCTTCFGIRKVDDMDNSGRPGRPYMMLCVLRAVQAVPGGPAGGPGGPIIERALDLEKQYKASMHSLVLDTKIRTTLTENTLDNGFELPAGAPLHIATAKRRANRMEGSKKGERHMDPTDPLHLEMQKIVRESFGQLYSGVVVKRATKGSKQYTINVTGQNCRYCQNIGREHVSNNIFFVITKDGISQRCFDTGSLTPEMRHGICKDYVSGCVPLSASAQNRLWPETTDALSVFAENIDISGMRSFAMQALLRSGEFLMTSLHGSSWTATLGLQSSSRKGLKDFMPLDPRDLGSRGIGAYKDLGFAWADQLLELKGHADYYSDESEHTDHRTIAELEKALMNAFDTIVVLASTSKNPELFETCVSMDDFCGRPTVSTEDDAHDDDAHDDDSIIECDDL
jgi:hypothetical protein